MLSVFSITSPADLFDPDLITSLSKSFLFSIFELEDM